MAQASAQESLSEQEMLENLARFRANRQQIMKLNNKILSVRLEQLRAIKKQYRDYLLDLDLKSYEATLELIASKSKFNTYQDSSERVGEIERQLETKNKELDDRIAALKSRLIKFKSLDPNLLAEYRKLKDDLECQELLIKIGEDNKTPQ